MNFVPLLADNMGCVLHLSGRDLDLDGILAICPVEPCTIFRRGEPLSSRPNSRVCQINGLNLEVSSADFDNFEQQQLDAIGFLSEHQATLKKMRECHGIDNASIDFGIAMRNVISQSDTFMPELISLIAPLNIALELSQYPVGKKNKKIKQYRRALRKSF